MDIFEAEHAVLIAAGIGRIISYLDSLSNLILSH